MSAGLLFVGSYIRSSVHETKDFAEAKAKMPEVKYPLLDAFKRYPKMMVACMGARLIDGVAFNTFAVFSLSYLTQTRGLERSSALAVVMIASVVMSFFIPFWGYVADRIGKARVFGFCALLLGILGFPAFWVFHNYSDNYLYVCLALALPFGVVYAAVFGTMSSLFSDSFDPSVRYSAISFVYQFSGIFAAGLTPMVASPGISAPIWAPLASSAPPAPCGSGISTERAFLLLCLLRVKPPFRNRSWKANPPSRAGEWVWNRGGRSF